MNLNPEESSRTPKMRKDEYLKQIESLEERLQRLHQQNVDMEHQNTRLDRKNEKLERKVNNLKYKKKLYKNQVESQCHIMKDQMTQIKIMQSEQANLQAKL